MVTPKRPPSPRLALSRVCHTIDSIELAKAIQNPDCDPEGYPSTCQNLIDHPDAILRPEWTDFIVKILKRHRTDPLLCRYLIERPERIREPWFTPIIVLILQQHVADHPRINPDSRLIALIVDVEILFGRPSTAIADVAKATGKSEKAVEKAHVRYGKQKC